MSVAPGVEPAVRGDGRAAWPAGACAFVDGGDSLAASESGISSVAMRRARQDHAVPLTFLYSIKRCSHSALLERSSPTISPEYCGACAKAACPCSI